MAEKEVKKPASSGTQVQSGMTRIGEILITISAVFWCFTIIGMAWGIPMIKRNGKRKTGEMPITIAHVVVSILFFWWIGGILVAIGGDVKTS